MIEYFGTGPVLRHDIVEWLTGSLPGASPREIEGMADLIHAYHQVWAVLRQLPTGTDGGYQARRDLLVRIIEDLDGPERRQRRREARARN